MGGGKEIGIFYDISLFRFLSVELILVRMC